MKRIFCLFLAAAILFCGCTSESSDTSTEYDAIDLSYEDILQLSDFKCYIQYEDNETIIEGTRAKELYGLLYHAPREADQTPTVLAGNRVYLVFYAGEGDYLIGNIHEYFGAYTVCDEGYMLYSLSPLHSSAFRYNIESDLFPSVTDFISS